MTFPSPWSRSEILFTRWPGPVTIRYRSVVCSAEAMPPALFAGGASSTVVKRRWRAEDPDLAEAHGLPRETKPTNPWGELLAQEVAREYPALSFLFDIADRVFISAS